MLTPSFFAQYWQRRVLFSSSKSADSSHVDRGLLPSRLISLCDIEYLISSLGQVDPNWIQLVKDGLPLRAGAYCNADGSPSLPRIYAACEAGHTIQLAKLHKRWPAAGQLCRAAETACLRAGVALAMRVGSHLYLTPPRSTGLDAHYDNHDVVVVQAAGAKRWKIYGAMQEVPVEMQAASVPRSALPALQHDLLLEPGDVLYVPRGLFHEASTADDYSVHITLDLTAYTWADLFRHVMQRHPSLRESLPVGALGRGGAGLREGCKRRAAALAKSASELQGTADAFFGHFLADIDLLPDGGLDQLDSIPIVGLDTWLRRRAGVPSMVIEGPSGVSLCFPGAGVSGSPVLAAWLCDLAEERPFAVREFPDDLDPNGKVAAARELLSRGFLELASSSH